VTDSELVPWGKGEKAPRKGNEKILKLDANKQWEVRSFTERTDRVPIEEWTGEFYYSVV